jgi:hypothetical protein
MAFTLRFTAASSDYRDWLDYTIVEDGCRDVGRPYEDRHSRPRAAVVLVYHDLARGHRPSINARKRSRNQV